MSSKRTVHVTRAVRPIRLAFLAKPDDKKNLRKIFEINTCIWGGRYNGIVPVFKRTPKWWGRESRSLPSAREITQGYIAAFEPDYLVTTHKDQTKDIAFDKDRILSIDDIFQDETDDKYISYGLNVSTIYKDHYDKQFRFQQRHQVDAILPKAKKTDQLFCSAVFGAFPKSKNYAYFLENYKTVFDPKEVDLNSKNLFSLLTESPISPLKIGSSFIEIGKRPWSLGPTLFFLDPNKPSDLIDYWNLRALGWRILPVPRAWSSDMVAQCKKFVKENHVPLRGNPNGIMHETSVLKSRHIDDDEFKKFASAIRLEGKSALIQQNWHPRIWDDWARDKDHADRCNISHSEEDIECPMENGQIIFSNLAPSFDLSHGYSHKPRWANIVKLRDYGHAGDSALVFPPSLKNLGKLLNTSLERTTFTDSEGIISLVSYEKSKIYWKLPTGFSVFQTWLSEKNFKAELSVAGQTAQHLIKALGGPWGLRHISDLEIIKLLDKMAHGLVEVPIGEDEAGAKPTARSRMESRQTWWQLLLKINENRKDVARRHLNILSDKGVLRIGLKVECADCGQPNWYPLGDISEKLRCERCLQLFSFPVSDPPSQAWHYRTQGAFSVENYAHGAYSVGLALRFLISTMESDATWAPSLEMTGANGLKLECDFAIWRTGKWFGKTVASLVFGECKSFDEFKAKDITRAKELAEQFPGSILVFATLRSELQKDEISRLIKLAKWGRKSIGADKLRAPVLVLTGHELFSDWGPPNCWKDAGGKYAEFAKNWQTHRADLTDLCDATNQLHLGMESYGTWSQEQWENKKRSRRTALKIRGNTNE